MYPLLLHANVLLLDGEIINWKTGMTSWEDGKWVNSKQPLNIVLKVDRGRLKSETFSKIVNNYKENNTFFEKIAVNFYKTYEVSERYSNSMFRPIK